MDEDLCNMNIKIINAIILIIMEPAVKKIEFGILMSLKIQGAPGKLKILSKGDVAQSV